MQTKRLFADGGQGFAGEFLEAFGAFFEFGVFFCREFGINHAVDAAFADDGGQRQADVFDAFDVVVMAADGQNGVFVVGDDLADMRQGTGNAVEGGAFAVNDLVGGIADAVVDFGFSFLGERTLVELRQFFD